MLELLQDQGTLVMTLYCALATEEKHSVLACLGRFTLQIIGGMEKVEAERDGANLPSETLAPTVMPGEVATLPPRDFNSTILNPLRAQLSMFWSEEDTEAIERDHRELCHAYSTDVAVKTALLGQNKDTTFNSGWDELQRTSKRDAYVHLRQFAVVWQHCVCGV
ncbi:hypothetical protein JG687_00014591 [Phytophthora cactorum]|uniref:Uncharacterized protein n=1 Tax=Phytophthora cactorum TaxID=29920 RepID=A0A8T1TZB8_9STRA|nr:hypothetical protein JG687_00014591 [Phytophthora cactorum]